MTPVKNGIPVHLAVRRLFGPVDVPACGAWSRNLTSDPERVRCGECEATLDYAMTKSAVRAQLEEGG